MRQGHRPSCCLSLRSFDYLFEKMPHTILLCPVECAPIEYLNIGGTTNWSMYEICDFLCRISSSPICGTGDIRCVANGNVQNIAFFCRFFTATRWVTEVSKIGNRGVNLRIKLHFSCINLWCPPIFNWSEKFGGSTSLHMTVYSSSEVVVGRH